MNMNDEIPQRMTIDELEQYHVDAITRFREDYKQSSERLLKAILVTEINRIIDYSDNKLDGMVDRLRGRKYIASINVRHTSYKLHALVELTLCIILRD